MTLQGDHGIFGNISWYSVSPYLHHKVPWYYCVLSDIYQGITMLLIEISSKYYDNTMVFCEMPYQQNTIVQFWICILLLGYSISPSSHYIQKEQ